MAVVFQMTGMQPTEQAEHFKGERYEVSLVEAGIENPGSATFAQDAFSQGTDSPFDMSKTYKVTIETVV